MFKNKKLTFLLFFLLLLLIVIIFFYYERNKVQKNSGFLGGKFVSIPDRYIKYPIEYFGESVWSEKYSIYGNELKDIKSFTAEVCGDEVVLLSDYNNDKTKLDSCFLISPVSWPPNDTVTDSEKLLRLRNSMLEKFDEASSNRKKYLVKYKAIGEYFGLIKAVPVTAMTLHNKMSYESIYWKENDHGEVVTLLTCPINSNAENIGNCSHRYLLKEMTVTVNLYYDNSKIANWYIME